MLLEPDDPTPEGYSDVLERLSAEGIDARFSCLFVPVQLEGKFQSGERIFFYCRGRSCWLGVSSVDGDPIAEPTWYQKISRWEESEAGYLDHEEAEAVLRELLAAYGAPTVSESTMWSDCRICTMP